MTTTKRPYGLWSSALTPKSMAGQLRLNEVLFTADGGLVWSEGRSGQGVAVFKPSATDAPRDLTTAQSVRGGVGYGGGDLGAYEDTVYFACADGRLYRVGTDYGSPEALTPAFGRLASPTPSPDGARVAFVHTYEGRDAIGVVDADGHHWPAQLASGADFYMQPAWHPEGASLAYIAWDHPNMPWNGTRLEVVLAHGDTPGEADILAGGEDVAVQQPAFSPSGDHLAYLSDESGWWHVYVRDMKTGETRQLTSGDADHAGPAWIQGLRTIGWMPDGSGVWAIRNDAGKMSLWRCPLGQEPSHVDAFADYEALAQLSVDPQSGDVAVIASAAKIPTRIVRWSPGSEHPVVIKRASSEHVPPEALAAMRPVEWEAADGSTVYGNYYAPTNPRFEANEEAPPLLVMIHGGPTSQRTAEWNARNQFFATRGWAVLDVNYRGSTGYGRAYMEALMGKWGILDVEDAVSGVRFAGAQGLADPERAVIMGGSAGGYTVLHALVRHPGVFAAGVSMYGISNLFTLAAGTHKFESSYNDTLLGPLPEASQKYRERSPIFSVDQLTDPVAVFQGAEDKVVPKDQADAIVDSLAARGVSHVYHVYEGEGHGWRKSETIEHFYEATLRFLRDHILFS